MHNSKISCIFAENLNTMNWHAYRIQLDQLFDHSGFDILDKLGFPIWENEGGDEYTSALIEYHNLWAKWTPQQKAEAYMTVLRVSPDELVGILNETDYSIVQ